MALPDTYSELYPNRFLKADLLKGKKVTVTIAKIEIEELEGEKGKENKVVMYFAESKRQYVAPKTVGFCLMRMFGKNPREWVGKMVTLYPTTTKFGRETVDCVRVWGSPNISADMPISIPQGRKKPMEAVMHKIQPGECGYKGGAEPQPVVQVAEEAPVEDYPVDLAEAITEQTYDFS